MCLIPDTVSNTFDTVSNTFDTVSNTFDTVSNTFDTVSNTFDTVYQTHLIQLYVKKPLSSDVVHHNYFIRSTKYFFILLFYTSKYFNK
jgi:hypothetical protein